MKIPYILVALLATITLPSTVYSLQVQKNSTTKLRNTRATPNADQMVQNILQWLQGAYTQNSRKIRQGTLREYLPPANTEHPRPFGYPPAGAVTPYPPFTVFTNPATGGVTGEGFETPTSEIVPPDTSSMGTNEPFITLPGSTQVTGGYPSSDETPPQGPPEEGITPETQPQEPGAQPEEPGTPEGQEPQTPSEEGTSQPSGPELTTQKPTGFTSTTEEPQPASYGPSGPGSEGTPAPEIPGEGTSAPEEPVPEVPTRGGDSEEPSTPEQPAPEEPAPEEPAPSDGTPEEPSPEEPEQGGTPEEPSPGATPEELAPGSTPEEPLPEEPLPEEPLPEEPLPEEPLQEEPLPEEPLPEEPLPEEPLPEEPLPEEPFPEEPVHGGTTEEATPEEPAPGGTPEEPSPEEPAEGSTPEEPSPGATPEEPTPGGTPEEPTSVEPAEGGTPEEPSPEEPAHGVTPEEPSPGETPEEPESSGTPEEPSPEEPAQGVTPEEASPGATPEEPASGGTPDEPSPEEPAQGGTPEEQGGTPEEPSPGATSEGPAPGSTDEEHTPAGTPEEPSPGATPEEPSPGDTVEEPTPGGSPEEPAQGEPSTGETPEEPTPAEEPTAGGTSEEPKPEEPATSGAPEEPSSGGTPAEPVPEVPPRGGGPEETPAAPESTPESILPSEQTPVAESTQATETETSSDRAGVPQASEAPTEGSGETEVKPSEETPEANTIPSSGSASTERVPTEEDLKHPPHIHEITVQCAKDMMTINIEFNRPFDGVIYSKGYFNTPECRYVQENTGQTKYSFTVSLNSCGTEFIDALDTEGQSYLENILVIQNEPGIQEVWDTIRVVRCLWEGNLKEALSVGLTVGMLNQEIITFSGDTAMAKLDVHLGRGPFGQPVNGLVKIGEEMTLVVSVTGDPGFDIQVKDCRATDSTDSNTVQLTDDDGCILKPKLFGAFQKTRETGNTGATIIAYAYFNAFKFPDVMDLMIQCNIELCKTDCDMCSQEDQALEPSSRRRRRRSIMARNSEDLNNTTLSEGKTMRKHLMVILPEDLSSEAAQFISDNTKSVQTICMSIHNFVFSTSILVTLLVASCIVSGYLLLKNSRKPYNNYYGKE